jgi:hypothetical protein
VRSGRHGHFFCLSNSATMENAACAVLIRTAGINTINQEIRPVDRVDRGRNKTTGIAKIRTLGMQPTKNMMVKRGAVPKRTSGTHDKARGQKARILCGPGPSNEPTNCSGSVKYMKNGMELAGRTYYLYIDEGLCKAYTKPHAPMHLDCPYWITKSSLKRLL